MWVIFDRLCGFRQPFDVWSSPKATCLLRGNELTRRAINGLVHRKQFYSTTLSMSGEWLVEPINDVHFVEEPDAEAMPFTQPVRVRAGAAAL